MKMKIAVVCDHTGIALKEEVKKYLHSLGMEVIDLGTDSEKSVDYPVYGEICADAVVSGEADRGIAICGTGIGISIAANKIKGIRCALCTDVNMAELSRKHNDANMIAIGSRMLVVFRMFIFVVGIQQAGAAYFQYSGKPKISILLSLSRQVLILMPCVLILPRYFQLNGILYAGPISDVLSTAITGVFVLRELKRLDRLCQESEGEALA